jgi:spore germination cell wall hydrolase CwlJ-like protein
VLSGDPWRAVVSEDGLLEAGTVGMNRVAPSAYPKTICGVVGQPGQFASGVLWKPMQPDEERRVERIADEILAGKRELPSAKRCSFIRRG